MEQNPTTQHYSNDSAQFKKFMKSPGAGLIVIFLLTLILTIPLWQVRLLIEERGKRQVSVQSEIEKEWGGNLEYHGLVLKIPVIDTLQPNSGQFLYVVPETSEDKVDANVSEKYRSIFKVNIFSAKLESQVEFELSKVTTTQPYHKLDWNKVQLCLLSNSDATFKAISDFDVNGKSIAIQSQFDQQDYPYLKQTLSNSMSIDPKELKTLVVNFKTTINGISEFSYRSFSKNSELEMRSNWKNPSYAGNSLPEPQNSKVEKSGFKAFWNNMDIAAGSQNSYRYLKDINTKTSIVRFIDVVDHYILNERTAKYGILVFILTFAVFFLIQLVGKMHIHPAHYLLIGLSLVLFYSLLLSFSEQIGFIAAYLISAGLIIALISWYAKSILRSAKFAVLSGMSLTLTYGFILIIVNLETYALLFGSLGLLVVLAAIMSVTRKLKFE